MDVACQLNCISNIVLCNRFSKRCCCCLFLFYVRFILARRFTQTRQMIRIWTIVKLYTMALNPSYATSIRCFFFSLARDEKIEREKKCISQHSDIVFLHVFVNIELKILKNSFGKLWRHNSNTKWLDPVSIELQLAISWLKQMNFKHESKNACLQLNLSALQINLV